MTIKELRNHLNVLIEHGHGEATVLEACKGDVRKVASCDIRVHAATDDCELRTEDDGELITGAMFILEAWS